MNVITGVLAEDDVSLSKIQKIYESDEGKALISKMTKDISKLGEDVYGLHKLKVNENIKNRISSSNQKWSDDNSVSIDSIRKINDKILKNLKEAAK